MGGEAPKGQMDMFERPDDPDSVSLEAEAAARSGEKERMERGKNPRRKRAIARESLRRIKKMLQKKIDEENHPKLGL